MVGPFGFHPNKTMRSRAFNLARPLVHRGHQVRIFMPPWQTPFEADKSWEEDGVAIRYTPLGGGVVGIAARLLREVLAWRPDVVHGFKPKAYSGLVMWWLWQFHHQHLRLVLDADDWEGWGGWNELAPYSPWQKRFFAWQEAWGLKHCHALTVASRTLQSLAWSRGVPAHQVVYVPNGPGLPEIVQSSSQEHVPESLASRPTLLLYSRLFEFDTQRLVALLQMVKQAVPDLAVLAVGVGLQEEDSQRFRRQLRAAGLDELIVDVGWVEPEKLPALLAAADVGIYLMEDTLLNRTKCPVKLADMLHAGLPVVAEDVGQVGEYVVHQQTGLLYASGDVDGVAAGLVQLLGDETKREQMAAQARRHVERHFNWRLLSQRLEEVYLSGEPEPG